MLLLEDEAGGVIVDPKTRRRLIRPQSSNYLLLRDPTVDPTTIGGGATTTMTVEMQVPVDGDGNNVGVQNMLLVAHDMEGCVRAVCR